MSRNFGLGSRNMKDAGRMALKKGMQSFSSIASMSDRWNQFVNHVRPQHGIGRMERIDREMVQTYGAWLADKVGHGEMSPATGQTYVSAVNRVLEIARGDRKIWVSPTKDCGIARRSGIATENRAMSAVAHAAAKAKVSGRMGALLDLQRALGLRFEENAKLNPRAALIAARKHRAVSISDGTKGGRRRTVLITPVRTEQQIAALERAASLQGGDRSMIPSDQSYSGFRRRAYREVANAGVRFHSERHAYAQERYEALAGAPCPVAAGIPHGCIHHRYLAEQLGVSVEKARQIDCEARMQTAKELGHSRIGVTNAYLG